ncbi:hypothetical protein L596_001505 [Steinernema carpocapsae]|uniref:Uncharacterized protein n=1 Tax=Steinernema carpocapsae TaxID=34508 RepID=A0A4U8ULN9_STECR|nr:hypothetical protein L596_001505 [Steinernema carpocapsae]
MLRSTMLFVVVVLFGSAMLWSRADADVDEELERFKAWDSSCAVIRQSKNARLISSNVDVDQRETAIYEQTSNNGEYDELEVLEATPDKKSLYDNVLLRLKLGRYAEHICDANKFRPYVKELGRTSFTCYQMCYKCFPGSFAVCYVKNRMFPGVAQTCLCSYDKEQPINRAAFSLKQGGVIMPNLLRFH